MQSGAGQLKHAFFAFAIALFGAGLPARAEPRLTVESTLTWNIRASWFGGFSGIEISPDGKALTLITDRGSLVKARLHRRAGQITSIELLNHVPIREQNGKPLTKPYLDSEGLAISSGGQAYVSFETKDRVTKLDLTTGTTSPMPTHPAFDNFDTNTGLEALAVHPNGHLLALPEAKADRTGTTPLFRYSKGHWHISHRLPLSGPFRPVGADFDVLGRLYLLERAITPLGFRSRIRRLNLNTTPVTAQTLLKTQPAIFDNLEAISVWTDHKGQTRLTLMSDDNFLVLQKTQIVEFLLTE